MAENLSEHEVDDRFAGWTPGSIYIDGPLGGGIIPGESSPDPAALSAALREVFDRGLGNPRPGETENELDPDVK